MGYILPKPCTDEERENFIARYNQDCFAEGYLCTIEETDSALYAIEANELIDAEGNIVINTNYEEEQKQKEKERIQELFMTRSDFFDGTIDAWGIGEEELLLVIKQVLDVLPFDEKTERKALNNFKNALNFYRKHTLFGLLVGNPIKLTDTVQVTLTDEALDKYFDEVAKGNKETAWQYLPQPVAIPIEPTYDDI
jgi:hypothetical protein